MIRSRLRSSPRSSRSPRSKTRSENKSIKKKFYIKTFSEKNKVNCNKYSNCPKHLDLIPKKIRNNELKLIFVGCWGVYCKDGINMLYKPPKNKDKSKDKVKDKDKSKDKSKDKVKDKVKDKSKDKDNYTEVVYGGKTASDLMIEYSKRYNIDAVVLAGDNVYSDPYYYEKYEKKFTKFDKNQLYLINKQLKEGYINCYKNIITDMFLIGIGNHDIETCDILNKQFNFVDDKWKLPALSYVQKFILDDETKINMIFIDTNMYDEDASFCDNQLYSEDDRVKQNKWLKSILRKEKDSWNIVVGHIPFVYNIRKKDSDKNGNAMLKYMLKEHEDYIDLYMCADEHNQQYILDPEIDIPEVISGTGGAILDDKFIGEETEGTLLKRAGFGFVGMSIDTDAIKLEFVLKNHEIITYYVPRKR